MSSSFALNCRDMKLRNERVKILIRLMCDILKEKKEKMVVDTMKIRKEKIILD